MMSEFKPVRAQTFTIRAKSDDVVRKVFKLGFTASDGSIWIAFPYYRQSHGVAAVVSYPSQTESLNVNLGEVGRVTSHRVKYTHHRSGLALFSQTGKVFSEIRKPSIPLSTIEGHLCTVHVSGLTEFAEDDIAQPDDWISATCPTANAHTVTFDIPSRASSAIKFVVHCYNKRRLRPLVKHGPLGPLVFLDSASPTPQQGVLLAAPIAEPGAATYLIVKAATVSNFIELGRSCLVFIGGFDPPEIARDPTKPTSMLALSYPVDKYEDLLASVGTIDLGGEIGREHGSVGSDD
jgi:virulence-associated protein VapD